MKALILIGCVFLAGCAGNAKTRAITSFAIACDSYSSSLKTLSSLRKARLLSPSQVAKVEAIRTVTTPVCMTKNPIDPLALLNKVEQGVFDLIAMKAERQ
jgi:outer membrane murein-binding lipoprotein Lpp